MCCSVDGGSDFRSIVPSTRTPVSRSPLTGSTIAMLPLEPVGLENLGQG